jgi:urease accessory protein
MASSAGSNTTCSSAELTFATRGGRTVLAHSRVQAPIAVVRPFALDDGGQLVQLITIGPGLCAGDRLDIRISAQRGTRVVITTPAATRVLSMEDGQRAEQHVDLHVEPGATLEYYPAVTIPFPDSALLQTIRVDAASGSRVGVLETWAMGRTSRDEYLRFRRISSRTTLAIDGRTIYADATELQPGRDRLDGAGVLAGRRYLASGVWGGVTLPDETARSADAADLVAVLAQSRPEVAYLRAVGSDAPALDAALRAATDRIATTWDALSVRLDRFRC